MTSKRRSFTPEYKAEVVSLVREAEKSIGANDYRDLLKRRSITCSMSRTGNCWDTQSSMLVNIASV